MKFKLTTETKLWLGRTLYRIEALVDFANVKTGDKGGFVETEANVSQDGDAWVYDNAQVYDNARVYGNAQVYDNARVYDNAWVYGDARVYGNAQVSPVNLIGLPYSVTITDAHMQIGCELHLIADWAKFDDRRIAEMDGLSATRFWRDYGAALIGVCRASRPDAFAPAAVAVSA